MPGSFPLKLLGVPQLLDPDGGVVLFRTRKHFALLIYLALEAGKRPVSREVLVDMV